MRILTPIIEHGVISGVAGLDSGQSAVIVPFGLVEAGIIEQSFADWLYEHEPLTDETVIVVAAQNDRIIKHRADIEYRFAEATISAVAPQAEQGIL